MKNKLFIGVIIVCINEKQFQVETCLCRAESKAEAEIKVNKFALRYLEKNNLKTDKYICVVQEKDLRAARNIVNDFTTPQEFFANIVRTEIRSALNEKPVDCVSDKFVFPATEVEH